MKSYYCCVFLIIYFKTIFMYPDAVWHRVFSSQRR